MLLTHIFFNNKTILFSIILLFASCANNSDCKKITLSKKDLSWFLNYKNNQKIYFKNQADEVDTFVVEVLNKPDYTDCYKFELGEYVYPTIYLRFRCLDNYQIEERRKNYHLEFYKSIEDTNNVNCSKSVSFFELDTETFTDFNSLNIVNYEIAKNHKKIDLYVFEKDINAVNNEGLVNIMESFAISKEYGLVWYKTVNGDSYERVW